MKAVQLKAEIRQSPKEDRPYWERHIQAQQTSGISRAEYAVSIMLIMIDLAIGLKH
jgi:hypothetical protein